MLVTFKRRWLTYSTRTLLIAVTVFCVWLGYERQVVQERKAVIRLVVERGAFSFRAHDPGEPNKLLWIPQLLGDEQPYGSFIVHQRLSDDEKSRIKRAYPNANLIVWLELMHQSTGEVVLFPCGAEDLGR
jgi:hypothetical protein